MFNNGYVGIVIKKNRERMNLSQTDLANLLLISYQTVEKWESGELIPDMAVISNICSILHTTISAFFDESEAIAVKETMKKKSDKKVTNKKSKTIDSESSELAEIKTIDSTNKETKTKESKTDNKAKETVDITNNLYPFDMLESLEVSKKKIEKMDLKIQQFFKCLIYEEYPKDYKKAFSLLDIDPAIPDTVYSIGTAWTIRINGKQISLPHDMGPFISAAFSYFKELSTTGDAESLFYYGLIYTAGGTLIDRKYKFIPIHPVDYYSNPHIVIEKDINIAYDYFLESAKKGYAVAQWFIGKTYLKDTLSSNLKLLSSNSKENKKNSIFWLTKSAEQNYADAQYLLGQICLEWKGYIDEEKGIKHLNLASAKGNIEAMRMLAGFYYNGKILEKNIDKSLELLLKVIENNNCVAKDFEILGDIFKLKGDSSKSTDYYMNAYLKPSTDKERKLIYDKMMSVLSE